MEDNSVREKRDAQSPILYRYRTPLWHDFPDLARFTMALKEFEFNDETISYFRESRFIPLNFYNRSGQILIPQKPNATENEINNLLKFRSQGIFYNDTDEEKLKRPQRSIPTGLSDTKLLSKETTDNLVHDVSDIFKELKSSSISAISIKRMKNTVNEVFQKFEKQPDAMNGLVNILELMKGSAIEHEMQIAIKRTVIAMALKTRGMTTQGNKDAKFVQKSMNDLMVSAMLCDIGYNKMTLPEANPIDSNQMQYIRNHPLVSYLMIAHEDSIDPVIKRNVLVHHRTSINDSTSNNYPARTTLYQKLVALYQEYSKIPEKRPVANAIAVTLNDLKQDVKYDEDANILAISSEFASLTTDVPWRKAIPPIKAVKMILNNSYFSYHPRSIREFLDQVAVSLCDNKLILNNGDFVIIALESASGSTHFEICKIIEINRLQSRPMVERIGAVKPIIEKEPKLKLSGFEKENIVLDKRHAKYHLENDLTRRMIYVIDKELNPDLFNYLNQINIK